MTELIDNFTLANNLVENFFMDLINGANQESVDNAFKDLGLNRIFIENKLIRVNEKVNPFKPDQMGHNASKKIIYKAILTLLWEEKMTNDLGN
tara:strand:- start:169 stop:447 length:279 start_codon:yes stop_codon:yes gene_type:complete